MGVVGNNDDVFFVLRWCCSADCLIAMVDCINRSQPSNAALWCDVPRRLRIFVRLFGIWEIRVDRQTTLVVTFQTNLRIQIPCPASPEGTKSTVWVSQRKRNYVSSRHSCQGLVAQRFISRFGKRDLRQKIRQEKRIKTIFRRSWM